MINGEQNTMFNKLLLAFFMIFYALNANARVEENNYFKNAKYEVCFTPGEDCTNLIVKVMNLAKKELLIQAYSFTSTPIAKATIEAKKRGVLVQAILDKSQFKETYSASKFLMNQGIPLWEDNLVQIAHNKVMIIDNSIVITGSFNFLNQRRQKIQKIFL